ncbi:raffinose/stachyose/melibiose transport system substrate-binding protein [Paenibacillus sp. V4I9]|uniref:ABC transporter substrate-binding protein n=1 Tax=Paenibacillus sp. V4I9 TaxID=3042308 RepID=UPI002785FC86|nr:extracellular solute-binding protein [Paenibacillus sp. V4I9]MDQ0886824.1 raffinose/stachyose/melibiose transport system substrate-binding protein [Paenibacillus sp. V4I9]
MRKWIIGLTALSFIITTAGCSKAANQPVPSNGQAQKQEDRTDEAFTLRVSYWAQDKNGYFDSVEKKFKAKYPKATIHWDKLDEKNFAEVTENQLKSGQAADILFNQKIKEYAKAGYLLDLSDQPWTQRMIDSAKQTVAYKGKTYGAALDVSTFGVYYNKTIFDRLQLEPPKTWDQFMALNVKIKQTGLSPIIGGFKDVWTIQGVYIPIAATSEFLQNPNFELDLYAGKVKIDGPEVNDAMKKFTDLAHKGFYNSDALQIGYEESTQQFIDGKGAMQLMGSWTPGVVDSKTADFKMGFFALPDQNGKTVMAAAPDKQVSINAKTLYPVKAKYLLSLLLDKDMLAIYSKNVALSAFKDVIAEYTNPAMKDVQKALQLYPTSINPGHLFTNSANDAINAALNHILSGKVLQNELKEADVNYIKDKATLILD